MRTNLTLLQGGTVLIHDDNDHVQSLKTDLLIEGNTISKIEGNIKPTAETEVVDCRDKLISPGFIDTHHHVWQTLLKGRHANEMLLDYFYTGNFTSEVHSAEDSYWGELGGVLECIDNGTTTVVDHAHSNYSPDHSKASLAATVSSGIRSIFGYCPTPRLASWSPFALNPNFLEPWVMETLSELASKAPFGDGRVQIGFAFDGYFLPKEMVVDIFTNVKAMGIKLITSHDVRMPTVASPPVLQVMNSYGILDSSVLISHCTPGSLSDGEIIRKTGCHISSTPSTELQMALGTPLAFQTSLGIQHQCSVGIDCHSNNSASIPSELRLLLQSSRGTENAKYLEKGVVPKEVFKTVEEAFNLGTISGARAINMQDQIGSLKVGKKADLVIWDALSPGLVCAAEHDPVAAIVLHSSPSDIDAVIVDGKIRKKDGKLLDVDAKAGRELWDGEKRDVLKWGDVARELVERRKALQGKIEGLDMKEARKGVIENFYMDESKVVETLP